jgi:hypothetical protein
MTAAPDVDPGLLPGTDAPMAGGGEPGGSVVSACGTRAASTGTTTGRRSPRAAPAGRSI